MWIKDPDPVSDPGDPKRPDPTGSGSATLGERIEVGRRCGKEEERFGPM